MKKHALLTLLVSALSLFSTTLAWSATGGPDAFGYTFIDSLEPGGPAFDFVDISATGTQLFLTDDEMSGPVAIGFPFNFYGIDYTDVHISSNGFFSFLAGQTCCTPTTSGEVLPTPGDPDAVVAAWWGDLNPNPDSPDFGGGSIHTQTLGTAPNRVFIVQFTDVRYFSFNLDPPVTTHQYKLFEGSNIIEIQYADTDPNSPGFLDNRGFTAGIENETGTVGLGYLNDEDIFPPLAVRYAPPRPPACPLEVTKSCFIEPPPAADFACEKPIDEITMIWDGMTEPVRIKAYKGDTGDALLLDTGAISPTNPGVLIGDEVAVSGYAGSGNDVIWEVFDEFGNLLGESTFHLSCSDKDMNGETDGPAFPQDCGKRQGNGKKDSNGRLNDWLLEGMVDAVGELNCTPDAPLPSPDPVTECELAATGGECTKRPTSISFRYHAGNDCTASSNNQKPGKTSCTDFGMTPDLAHIIIGKDGGGDVVVDTGGATVADGDVVVGDRGSETYDSQIMITIMDAAGATLQEISMHSSCSQELKTGDRFGAMEIVGFTNEEQGVVGGGGPVEVLYTYTFTNKSLSDEIYVQSEDDFLGDIPSESPPALPGAPGWILLAPDSTREYMKSATVSTTTTNTLTSTAWLAGPVPDPFEDFLCTEEAMATVTITGGSTGPGPGPAPCSVSAEDTFKIKGKKLEWKITNTGSTNAVIESIDVSWPAANGNLKKIKRGGKKIVKTEMPPPAASITSFEGDAKDRTIKAGKTDKLKFEFKKDADKDPGKYAITVNFEGGCSATF